MDECKWFIVCKNRIKYRPDAVAIIAENTKDEGRLVRKTCRFEIDANLYIVVLLKEAQAWICHKTSHM